jgi:sugar phosphate permease
MLVTMAAHGFGRMAYTLILPEMLEGLALNYTQSGLLGSGNFAGYLSSCIIGGMLASRYGSRKVISISLLFTGVTMLLTGMATSFQFALAMRFLTGLGHGGAYIPAMALGAAWFSVKRRGFATGLVSAGVGLGIVVSSLIVPPILTYYADLGWRFSWYYLGAAVLAVGIYNAFFLRNMPADMGLRAVGEEDGPATGEHSLPIMRWDLVYRNKLLWYLGLVYLMNGFTYVIYMTFFKAFLISEAGLPEVQVNMMWLLVGVFSIISGVLWGTVSDVIGRKYGISLAYFTLAISFAIFAFSRSTAIYFVSVSLFGLCIASVPTIVAVTARDYTEPQMAPAAIGLATIFFGAGQVLGPAVGGYFADVTGSFRVSFAFATVISLVGLVAALGLKEPD